MGNLRLIALGATSALVAALLVMWYLGQPTNGDFAQCTGGQVAGGDIGGPFELVSADGQTVTDAEVMVEPSLVYFGYTYCPDVCPFDVTRNADAVDILMAAGHDVQPVFITIDPKRDTPDVLSDYAMNMHDRMVALTGSDAQIKTAAQAYKAYYKAHDDGSEDYLVDHSTFTYLVLPGHGFVDFFRRDVSAEAMAERTSCFLERV